MLANTAGAARRESSTRVTYSRHNPLHATKVCGLTNHSYDLVTPPPPRSRTSCMLFPTIPVVMPHIESRDASPTLGPALEPPRTLRDIFPPVRKSHILNCSFPCWHLRYRSITPRARTVPLTPAFLTYLREDGIVLPEEEPESAITSLSDSEDPEDESTTEGTEIAGDPTARFPEVHQQIIDAISALGGRVAPKLNWSSPKDAAFISATNTLECRTPGDIYLLLKSSDFITHDLEHALDDCVGDEERLGEIDPGPENINFHLVLRKWFQLNPSVEFRCFVRNRKLLGITQRDLNHYEFLEPMKAELVETIESFFEEKLRDTFPDPDFVFDVYIPQSDRDKKVWLIDINPFAPRTDALLFSWTELLEQNLGEHEVDDAGVELRLVRKDDPEAYSFTTSQYSASKMPKEVVDAGVNGDEAIWEFAARWREITREMEAANSANAT